MVVDGMTRTSNQHKTPSPVQVATFLRGRPTPLDAIPEPPAGSCGCGCGVPTPNRYVHGHHRRKRGPLAIVESGPLDTPCWIWQGNLHRFGYGIWAAPGDGRQERFMAHRISYLAAGGLIPAGLVVDHLCFRPACVNPAHLEPVRDGENTQRSWRAGRAGTAKAAATRRAHTHCARGHEWTDENTIHRDGKRHCRNCRDTNRRRWYEANAESERAKARVRSAAARSAKK